MPQHIKAQHNNLAAQIAKLLTQVDLRHRNYAIGYAESEHSNPP